MMYFLQTCWRIDMNLLENPKSVSFTIPSFSKKTTFSGFRSLCTTCSLWQYWIAVTICLKLGQIQQIAQNRGVQIPKIFPSFVLPQPSLVLHDVVVHVAPIPELQHQVQLGLRVNYLQRSPVSSEWLFWDSFLCSEVSLALVMFNHNFYTNITLRRLSPRKASQH